MKKVFLLVTISLITILTSCNLNKEEINGQSSKQTTYTNSIQTTNQITTTTTTLSNKYDNLDLNKEYMGQISYVGDYKILKLNITEKGKYYFNVTSDLNLDISLMLKTSNVSFNIFAVELKPNIYDIKVRSFDNNVGDYKITVTKMNQLDDYSEGINDDNIGHISKSKSINAKFDYLGDYDVFEIHNVDDIKLKITSESNDYVAYLYQTCNDGAVWKLLLPIDGVIEYQNILRNTEGGHTYLLIASTGNMENYEINVLLNIIGNTTLPNNINKSTLQVYKNDENISVKADTKYNIYQVEINKSGYYQIYYILNSTTFIYNYMNVLVTATKNTPIYLEHGTYIFVVKSNYNMYDEIYTIKYLDSVYLDLFLMNVNLLSSYVTLHASCKNDNFGEDDKLILNINKEQNYNVTLRTDYGDLTEMIISNLKGETIKNITLTNTNENININLPIGSYLVTVKGTGYFHYTLQIKVSDNS